MLVPWSDSATWNSFGSGMAADDIEAVMSPDATVAGVSENPLTIDVTSSLQAWVNDPSTNLGWVLLIDSSNNVTWASAECAVPRGAQAKSCSFEPKAACLKTYPAFADNDPHPPSP
jgi:hypothetical protein